MIKGIHFINISRQAANLSFFTKKCLLSTSRICEREGDFSKENEYKKLAGEEKNEERENGENQRNVHFWRGRETFKPKTKNHFIDEKKFEDTFGNIESFEYKFQRIEEDPEDVKEYERDRNAQGKTVAQYIREIEEHLSKNDYETAKRILMVDMHNDRKPSIPVVYQKFLNYNAERGNLDEAYKLYIRFKRHQGRMTGPMYTTLFVACANSRDSFNALQKAASLRESLVNDKHHKANIMNYNAMIKAFGKHRDLKTVFKIFDELLEKRHKVKCETYNFLLESCFSDKNSGLRQALIVWRKMLQNRVKPSIYSFNIMLKCVKDCFLGDVELVNDAVKQIMSESGVFYKRKTVIKMVANKEKRIVLKVPVSGSNMLPAAKEESKEVPVALTEGEQEKDTSQHEGTLVELKSDLVEKLEDENSFGKEPELPNLLALDPSLGSVIDFGAAITPHERLNCLGGIKGFLKVMSDFGVKPHLITFTILLEILPSTQEAEEELLKEAQAHGIKLDTTFYNILIKRRIFRNVETPWNDILKLMQKEGLKPDIVTFGVIAIGCYNYDLGMKLIEGVHSFGIRLNNEILGALLKNAGRARDMIYVKAILEAAKKDDVRLDSRFIAKVGDIIRRERNARLKESKDSKTELEQLNSSCDL